MKLIYLKNKWKQIQTLLLKIIKETGNDRFDRFADHLYG